jgi:CheY-like chemotaxis protein
VSTPSISPKSSVVAVAAVTAAGGVPGYTVRCGSCNVPFDAVIAEFCDCDVPLRTLRCPACSLCFCSASSPTKSRFWAHAPLALRQDHRRFGMRHPVFELAPPAAATILRSAPVIVVVDDEEPMRSLVGSFVQQLGYRVRIASDPGEALILAQEADVAVLITDALMPRVDGRELCRRLKASPEGAAKKVIVMTSLYTARRYRLEAYSVFNVDEYISKPIDLSALATILQQLAPMPRQ